MLVVLTGLDPSRDLPRRHAWTTRGPRMGFETRNGMGRGLECEIDVEKTIFVVLCRVIGAQ